MDTTRVERMMDLLPTVVTPADRLCTEGPGVLRDDELLRLLLGTGSWEGATLLERMPLWRLREARVHGLRALGLEHAEAVRLVCAIELGTRAGAVPPRGGTKLASPSDVAAVCGPRMAGLRREQLVALLVDGRKRLLAHVVVADGWTEGVAADPREVFGPALSERASAVIVVHNHPSGDPSPSDADRRMTKRLAAAGEALNVPLLDHVVVSSGGHASMAALGWCG